MAEPRRVRRTFVPYEAVLWTGVNTAELEAFAGVQFSYSTLVADGSIEDASILAGRYTSWVEVYPGDWVLKALDGSLLKVDGDEFESGFEDIPVFASGGYVESGRVYRVGG